MQQLQAAGKTYHYQNASGQRGVYAVLGTSPGIAIADPEATPANDALIPVRWNVSLAAGVLAYHAISLIALGSTPAVWVIETYLASRHPTTARAG